MSEANIILITGGGRSGKSTYAQHLAETLPGPRAYIATATPFDGELEERIAKHRGSRRDDVWARTIEEPLALARAIGEASSYRTVLVDCLTMWVGNLMWAAEQAAGAAGEDVAAAQTGVAQSGAAPPPAPSALTEADVAARCQEVVAACRAHEGTVVLVTNEVGLGIIPDNDAARLYRDLLGRCNQVMAAAADTVVLMVSGLPLTLKAP
jgi:adenosylcobinamide kinase / adenosylcobinamide-phosphate guanylyltransferase